MLDRSDDELIAECAGGNRQAFEELTKRYYPKAYSLALYRLHNRDIALDISQEAFMRVYRNVSRFQAGKSFAAWLYSIINNLCKNYVTRHRKRWASFSDHFPTADSRENALQYESEELERKEQHHLLYKSLQELPETDREIIILKELLDFSYQEIGAVMDIPVGTVMSRLYYARKKLAKRFRELAEE